MTVSQQVLQMEDSMNILDFTFILVKKILQS